MAGPLIVKLKHLMREIYEDGTDWKEAITEHLAKEWKDACRELHNISLSLPRYVGSSSNSSTAVKSLWVFADASGKALATCAFIRHEETRNVSPLISGKTRLTPKKTKQTIPRLETLALLMATRLAKTIAKASKTKFQTINILSDSEIALSWLKSSKNLPRFVDNQKARILRLKQELEAEGGRVTFYHVPTKDNPADTGTRGITVDQLNDLPWISGPKWLSEEHMPKRLKNLSDITQSEETEDNTPDQSAEEKSISASHAKENSTPLVDLSRFSRLTTAIRTIACVCKVLCSWLTRVNTRKENLCKIRTETLQNISSQRNITAEDMSIAETILFSEAHKHVSVRDLKNRFAQKKVFRDSKGIIRNASRLQNAPLSYDTKNPIFVDKDTDLARLILTDIHVRNAHCGKDQTLCIARQRIWIPRPSAAYKKYIGHCVICKKCHGLPFGAPEMPPLPGDRVIFTKPFQTVGCDFMGPLPSKSTQKLYVCLYTCLTTRAVHLEAVEDLSATAFLNSFIRFISRRGVPKIVRSDCGTNFKLGQRVIETMFDRDEENNGISLMSYSANQGIQWIFNPPGAPWMGGAWERLVGTVKRALTKSVGRKKLTLLELHTLVAQIEAIVNTRPLTALSSCVDDIPLRPIDFLQAHLKYSLAPTDSSEVEDPSYDPTLIQTVSQAKQAVQHTISVTEKFWEKWHVDYLTALREIQNIHRKQPRYAKFREPQLNEIVLVEQENLPRGSWCYGKITQLIKSHDGLVRSVKLLMPNKHIWHRPLNKIYPLEIFSEVSGEKPPEKHTQSSDSDIARMGDEEKTGYSRPARAAKLKAIKAITNLEKIGNIPATSPSHVSIGLPSIVTLTMIVTTILGCPVEATPTINCYDGNLYVHNPTAKFELCVRSTCRSFSNVSYDLLLKLPSTASNVSVNVSLRYSVESKLKQLHKTCPLSHVCDVSRTLLSKHLIGNPQCWPTGAIISAAALIYLIICVPALLLRAALLRSTAPTRRGTKDSIVVSQSENKGSSPTNTRVDNVNNSREQNRSVIQLKTFRPIPLGRVSAIGSVVVMLCVMLPHQYARAYQHGYTRHNVELICTSHNKCTFEFYQEILFNEINHLTTINIRHANKTIGTISVERLPLEFRCSKRTLYYTRDTEYMVFSATRCAQMGSCTHNACSNITSDSKIDEFTNASNFPGYSGCEPSCGGLLCGCLLPLPACSFYRVAHVPKDEVVYEIADCMEWKPIIRVKVKLSIYNTQTYKTLVLKPYVSETMGNTSITVISFTKPTCSLLKSTFAITNGEILRIPNNVVLPVECRTRAEALEGFSNCRNKIICDCNVQANPTRCICPKDSISAIKAEIINILPLSSPFVKLIGNNGKLTALSRREEMVVAVESRYMQNSAQYIVQQDCKISLTNLSGCYNCQEGATVIASCNTEINAWIIIQCDDHVFSVECNASTILSLVTLDFQEAVVNKYCHARCNAHLIRIPLQGTLAYLPHVYDDQIFVSHYNTWQPTLGWFQDWNLPDFKPVMLTIGNHWRLSLAIFGTTIAIAAATYITGPAAIIIIARIAAQLVKIILKITSEAFLSMLKLFISNINLLVRAVLSRK